MRQSRIFLILCAIAFIGVFCSGIAIADTLDTRHWSYPSNYSWNLTTPPENGTTGGPISGVTLNGVVLPWVFCIDLPHEIYAAEYKNAGVTSNGYVNGALINNYEQVAWLLDTYLPAATDLAHQEALQLAIWHVIYGDSFSVTAPNDALAIYNVIIASAIGNGNVSNYLWITPDTTTNSVQGLISRVPEPSLILLLGLGFGAVSLAGRRWKK